MMYNIYCDVRVYAVKKAESIVKDKAIQLKNFKMNGKQLATLLCTSDSTISRILNDLRSCKFPDLDNERKRLTNPYPNGGLKPLFIELIPRLSIFLAILS
ncbi:MAG TPA: hypothetical protein DDW42_01490 [Desulfobacteraceae bacterium]|nr:hypothetical protein [Desulfobacteraceae bacterium]